MDAYNNETSDSTNIMNDILNGLYVSSNVNLHKFRDYDPKLSNYIVLKE